MKEEKQNRKGREINEYMNQNTKKKKKIKLQDLTALSVIITVIWAVMPCSRKKV
jgi:predicted nucleic acid-binding Zn ribbon protein